MEAVPCEILVNEFSKYLDIYDLKMIAPTCKQLNDVAKQLQLKELSKISKISLQLLSVIPNPGKVLKIIQNDFYYLHLDMYLTGKYTHQHRELVIQLYLYLLIMFHQGKKEEYTALVSHIWTIYFAIQYCYCHTEYPCILHLMTGPIGPCGDPGTSKPVTGKDKLYRRIPTRYQNEYRYK